MVERTKEFLKRVQFIFYTSWVKMNSRKIWFISYNRPLKVGVIVILLAVIWRIHNSTTKQRKTLELFEPSQVILTHDNKCMLTLSLPEDRYHFHLCARWNDSLCHVPIPLSSKEWLCFAESDFPVYTQRVAQSRPFFLASFALKTTYHGQTAAQSEQLSRTSYRVYSEGGVLQIYQFRSK